MGWTALIVALYGLAKSILRAFGSFLPSHKLARKIIKAKLAALDVAPQTFSDRCVDELAAGSIKKSKHDGLINSVPWRECLEGHAEKTAVLVSEIVLAQTNASTIRIQRLRETASLEWGILARHEPQRFAHRNLVTSEGAAFAAHP